MTYRVKLDIFEGPFDLLVHLIETAKMDIYNIEISAITSQYLTYINRMEELKINVATEFIVLAANLMDIKSKMLLPKMTPDGNIEEGSDPRTELVERLLEYRRFKAAAKILETLEEVNKHVYEKPQEDISEYINEPDEHLSLDTKQFINAFEIFINRKKRIKDIKSRYEMVPRRGITTEERTKFIEKIFSNDPQKEFGFDDTLDGDEADYSKAVSFVSILELVKERKIKAKQERLFGDIRLRRLNRKDN